MMVLSMALITTSLLQVRVRPSNPASSAKADVGWEKAEQAGYRPHEMNAELGQTVSRLQVG